MLSKIDLTGAQFNIKLNATQEKQKSILGGLLTFLIYSASLAYSIYILILWSQGTLLPRVSSQMSALEEFEIQFPDSFISFNVEMGNYHPFTKNNNFLIPMILHETNGQFNSMEALFSDDNTISLPSSTISHSDSSEYYGNTLMFVLTPCNQDLSFNQTCAGDGEISNFLEELGTILKISIKLKQFNQKNNNYDEVTKNTYIVIDSQYNLYNQIKLKTTHNSHDTGMLFESYNYETYVNDREISTQPVSTQFAKQYFPSGVVPIFVTLISLDPIQTMTTIINPKLGEVFAQIGSIISMMMALLLISSQYNQLILEQQLLHSILIYIYPKLNDVKIKQNIFGKIIQATYKDQTINSQDYASKYKKAKEKLAKYLSISQIIQMIIQIQNSIQLENTWIGEIGLEFDQHFKYKINQVAVEDNEECQIQNKVSEIQEIFSR